MTTAASSLIGRTLEVLAATGSSYAQGPKAGSLDLGVGEARFETPGAVRALCATAIEQLSRIGYSDPQGESDLRDAYLGHLAQCRSHDVSGDREVLVTAGGKEAAWLAIGYALQDRKVTCALLPRPGWEPYSIWANSFGCTPLGYDPVAAAERPDVLRELVENAPIRPGLLVLNYPSNPTGVSVGQDQLDTLVALAAEMGMAVVSDEVYRTFAPQPASVAFSPGFEPGRDFVVDSVSKWLGMAGLRVGFLLGGSRALREIVTFRATYASCTSQVTQKLAAALLGSEAAHAWLAEMRAEVAALREAVARELAARSVPIAFHGGLYIWCKKPDPGSLLEVPGGATARLTAGDGFGAPGFVRLCVARSGLDPAKAADAVVATLKGS